MPARMSGDSSALGAQPARAADDRAVRVAQRDVGAHEDELVREDQAVLEHPLVDQDGTRALRRQGDRDRREVGRERGPRAVLDLHLVLAHVAGHDEVLAAGDEDVAVVEHRAQPEAVEDEADHPQVVLDDVLDAQLAARDARERHERPDLDVVGADLVHAAVEVGAARDREDVGADPLDVGAHLLQHPREVLDVRLARGVADDGRAGDPRGGQQRVLRAHDGRLVHEDVRRAQATRRTQVDVAVEVEVRPERAERVEVRIEPAATDHVTARRGHHGAAEARQQRPREQERRPDALRQRAVDLHAVGTQVAGTERDLVLTGPRDAHAHVVEQPEHRLDVLDARHVADDDLVLREHARGEDG